MIYYDLIWINSSNVVKTTINPPPVMTICIGGMFTIPSHGWFCDYCFNHMEVSWNGGTSKSSIFIGFSIINHPILGTPISGNPHINDMIWSDPIFHDRFPTVFAGEIFEGRPGVALADVPNFDTWLCQLWRAVARSKLGSPTYFEWLMVVNDD